MNERARESGKELGGRRRGGGEEGEGGGRGGERERGIKRAGRGSDSER